MKKIFYLPIIVLLMSCGGNSESPQPINSDDFDRSDILANAYDNIIMPAYNKFNSDLLYLDEKTNIFINNINTENLNNLRSSWAKAYKSWQAIEMFNLRKAEEINFARIANSYPCIEEIILNNINDSVSEIISFTSSMLGATGLPAFGYMIYGNDSSIIQTIFSGNDGLKYSAYLNALVKNLVVHTNSVIADWSISRSEFINSTSNTPTSSLNILVNDFVFYFEKKVRTAKIGIPIDFFGTLQPKPDQVESYYRPDLCKSLVIESMKSVRRLYSGESFDGINNGVGLSDYLIYLGSSDELITTIENQFKEIENKINLLEDDFILELNTNGRVKMEDVFLSMQNLVTYFKLDMMTDRFGISTDYQDNDGDGG
jgi:predicted lipoprotein